MSPRRLREGAATLQALNKNHIPILDIKFIKTLLTTRLRLPKGSYETLERQKRPGEHNPCATIKANDLQTPQ